MKVNYTENHGRYVIHVEYDEPPPENSGSSPPPALSVSFKVHDTKGTSPDDEPIFTGFIRWDGCSNWNDEGCLHFCGGKEAAEFGALLAIMYDIAQSEMWDMDLS